MCAQRAARSRHRRRPRDRRSGWPARGRGGASTSRRHRRTGRGPWQSFGAQQRTRWSGWIDRDPVRRTDLARYRVRIGVYYLELTVADEPQAFIPAIRQPPADDHGAMGFAVERRWVGLTRPESEEALRSEEQRGPIRRDADRVLVVAAIGLAGLASGRHPTQLSHPVAYDPQHPGLHVLGDETDARQQIGPWGRLGCRGRISDGTGRRCR